MAHSSFNKGHLIQRIEHCCIQIYLTLHVNLAAQKMRMIYETSLNRVLQRQSSKTGKLLSMEVDRGH